MQRCDKWVVLWSLWLGGVLQPVTPPLQLRSGGAVRGRVSPDGSHVQYFGIPYATVHHKHRFQAPGPAPVWDGVLDAVEEHARCAQKFTSSLVVGNEDCLRINVYVPHRPAAAAPLPVMVFIHGGGFFEGSGSRLLFGPDYLVDKDVILVTFNYRLSALGFLCLGTKEAPGNAGMKDQVAALKWVQMNIAVFGGDPGNVTIFGESAGSASVSYHILSPMSKGLFHKAILQSGSSLAPWSLHSNISVARAAGINLAKALGYDGDVHDFQQIHSILMKATAYELLTAPLPKLDGRVLLEYMPYVPCLENEIDGVEAFLTKSSYEILMSGNYNKVPVIIGSNDQEGYFFTSHEDDHTMRVSDFEKKLPKGLQFATDDERKEVACKVQQFYLGNDSLSDISVLKLSRFYGEAYFNYPALVEAETLARTSGRAVFSYRLGYDGWRNIVKFYCGPRYWLAAGASHADDLFYLFRLFPLPALTDRSMIYTMTTMWTNFAKYGKPHEKWPALDVQEPRSLIIGARGELQMAPLWRSASLRYWRHLHAHFGQHSLPPPVS